VPQPHVNHGWLGTWFGEVQDKLRRQIAKAAAPPPKTDPATGTVVPQVEEPEPPGGFRQRLSRFVRRVLRVAYRTAFGELPFVQKFHPLWADTNFPARKLAEWRAAGVKRVLWLTSGDSFFRSLLHDRVDPAGLLLMNATEGPASQLYDACFCELTVDEFLDLQPLYARIRPLVKDGGEILVWVFNKHMREIKASDIALFDSVFPDVDTSTLRFQGSQTLAIMRGIFLNASVSFPNQPILRQITAAAALIAFAPFVRLVNAQAGARNPMLFLKNWTSLVLEFKKHTRAPRVQAQPAKAQAAGPKKRVRAGR
jgi:hypothetical protein